MRDDLSDRPNQSTTGNLPPINHFSKRERTMKYVLLTLSWFFAVIFGLVTIAFFLMGNWPQDHLVGNHPPFAAAG